MFEIPLFCLGGDVHGYLTTKTVSDLCAIRGTHVGGNWSNNDDSEETKLPKQKRSHRLR